MKKIFTLCLGIAIAVSSYATHLMGGQISATYLSSDSAGSHYILDLEVYRDTLGVSMYLSQTVEVYLLDTTVFPPTFSLAFSHTIAFDTTSGGAMSSFSSVYGIEIYNFRDTITFPANGNYLIKWDECCRNGAIINMATPSSEYASFLTFVSVNSNAPNSTPTFLTPPVAYLPVDSIWQYNPLPFDPDGDSLVWTISVPLGAGNPIPVDVLGYGSLSDTVLYSNPNGIFSIDAITGQISWNPKMVGNFVAAFAIAEYRNGVLIGGMSRDMQFIVVPDSLNAMPQISNMQAIPINNLGYPYIKIAPGQNYQIHLLASDADANDVVSMDVYGEPFDISNPSTFIVATTGNGNEIEGTFAWNPNMSQLRSQPYIVVFRTTDNFFYYDETVQIEVTNNTTAFDEVAEFKVHDIYPNPANTNFTLPISLTKGKHIEVSIYNVLGVKVSSEQLNLSAGNHILVKHFYLNNGQYFVNITDGNGLTIITKKLLVIK